MVVPDSYIGDLREGFASSEIQLDFAKVDSFEHHLACLQLTSGPYWGVQALPDQQHLVSLLPRHDLA